MTKINQEEYELLKGLDDKWKWIVRGANYGGSIFCFREKPHKDIRNDDWGPDTKQFKYLGGYDLLFQFIKWEDEEPHNIAELIEEYEIENGMRYDIGKTKVVDIDTNKLAINNDYFYVKESEETEVKRDIEWLKNTINNTLNFGIFGPSDDVEKGYQTAMKEVLEFIDELDEQQELPPLLPDFSEKAKKKRLKERREVEKIIESLRK